MTTVMIRGEGTCSVMHIRKGWHSSPSLSPHQALSLSPSSSNFSSRLEAVPKEYCWRHRRASFGKKCQSQHEYITLGSVSLRIFPRSPWLRLPYIMLQVVLVILYPRAKLEGCSSVLCPGCVERQEKVSCILWILRHLFEDPFVLLQRAISPIRYQHTGLARRFL